MPNKKSFYNKSLRLFACVGKYTKKRLGVSKLTRLEGGLWLIRLSSYCQFCLKRRIFDVCVGGQWLCKKGALEKLSGIRLSYLGFGASGWSTPF